jgi:hypothetical protein
VGDESPAYDMQVASRAMQIATAVAVKINHYRKSRSFLPGRTGSIFTPVVTPVNPRIYDVFGVKRGLPPKNSNLSFNR